MTSVYNLQDSVRTHAREGDQESDDGGAEARGDRALPGGLESQRAAGVCGTALVARAASTPRSVNQRVAIISPA